MSTVIIESRVGIILSAMLWFKLIAALVPPYVLAGMGISCNYGLGAGHGAAAAEAVSRRV